MTDADTIIKHQERLATKRMNFDTWWQDIAERVLPSEGQFTVTSEEGEKRTERLFDGSPVTANERFAAVMEDMLTPRTQRWHSLAAEDPALNEQHEVKLYFEQVTNVLFSLRYRSEANFAAQKHEGYLSTGAFGNSALFIDEILGRGPRYIQVHMSEVFWAQDHQGRVDTLYRRFKLEGRQALQRFPDLPPKTRQQAEQKPYDGVEFIHCVKPNEEIKPSRRDHRGMPWSSFYVATADKATVEAGGYTSWPYAIGRYVIAPNETYARSPAMASWPAILTLNEEKKTILRAGQKEVDPPILLTEDGALDPFNLKSGALNYGMVTSNGDPLAIPFQQASNIPLGLELMQLEKQHIDDSFLVTVFQILLENQEMTATQVLEVAQQKGILLAPIMGRQHSEDLGPLIERELDIASKNGFLPPMPDVLRERGGDYKVEYRSPLARAMRAQDGVAIARTLEALPTAMQVDPNAAYVMDAQEAFRELADINGVPARLMRSRDQVAEILKQDEEREAIEGAIDAAPDVSKSALQAVQAEQIRRETALGA